MMDRMLVTQAEAIRSNWWSVPFAMFVHSAAIAAAALASMVVVTAVQDPDVWLTFNAPMALPTVPGGAPPAPKGTPRPQPAKADAPAPKRGEMQQPTVVERIRPEDFETMPDEPSDGGVLPEGDPNGVDGGLGDGKGGSGGVLGDGFGGGGTPQAPSDEPMEIVGEVKAPVGVTLPPPEYPEMARRARVEGVVRLKAVIDEHGRVTDVVVTGSVPLLDDAAVAAVKRWRYRPATLNGEPIRVYLNVGVTFALN